MGTLLLAIALAPEGGTRTGFAPPAEAERAKAIGDTSALPTALRRAIEPGDDFSPIRRPKPGDWLAEHLEERETYDAYVERGFNKATGIRKVIYLQPIGEFPKGTSPPLDVLKAYTAAVFGLEVRILPVLDPAAQKLTRRKNPHTRKEQILTGDILEWLSRKIPKDAYCVLGITMIDLYPEPSWNFVFGQAMLTGRVGVFSFARYDPAFYGEKRGADWKKTLLKRSLKVLAHETAHMFGLGHCVYFECIENGSNHLGETDARLMHLCPVCLRKLQKSAGFDVAAQHRALEKFYKDRGFAEEAAFVAPRLKRIEKN
ncbi:MAG: hypothetical protein HY897_04045 [Deltaproteobacteria bacterium]|nr:hypothetical protein [Deltaproteobacteria bacterium]